MDDCSGAITIRPFSPSDQLKAQEVILSGLQEHWGARDPSKNPDLKDIATSYANAVFLIACEDDGIVGTGALVPRHSGVAEIVRMSVIPSHRRRGIGRRILNELLRRAEAMSVRTVVLETTQTWHEVIEFYLAHGFAITHYQDGDVYFALKLPASR
ncbi:MAG: GNAT family N-acetyltransferase [Acidobacteria bacterium]|nr:GNAT family N-acetyltransferase [Acidobacteriota bacterium]